MKSEKDKAIDKIYNSVVPEESKEFLATVNRLKIEWPVKYGDIYIGYMYGVLGIPEIKAGVAPRWIVCVYTDNRDIQKVLPRKVNDYDVQVSGIPVAQ